VGDEFEPGATYVLRDGMQVFFPLGWPPVVLSGGNALNHAPQTIVARPVAGPITLGVRLACA